MQQPATSGVSQEEGLTQPCQDPLLERQGIPERLRDFAKSLREFGQIDDPITFAKELQALSPPLQRALVSMLQDVRVFSGEVEELTRRIDHFESGPTSSGSPSLEQENLKLIDRTISLPIPLERVVLILKISEFERQRRSNNRTVEEQMLAYAAAGDDGAFKYAAHLRQKATIDTWRSIIPADQVFEWDAFDWRDHQGAAAVVCIGGDNSMQLATHDAPADVLYVGINSDPASSAGALLLDGAKQAGDVLKALLSGNYAVELWSKLEVSVSEGGELLNLLSGRLQALSEVVVVEEGRRHTSKHILTLPNGEAEKQTGSGIIFATGVGNIHGAWADSASKMRRDIEEESKPDPQDSEALFILTEPQNGRLSSHHTHRGHLRLGETIVLESKNRRDGKLYLDALDGIPFPAGAKAEIKLSDKPVRVMRLG